MNIRERLAANAALVDAALDHYTAESDPDIALVLEACRYSLLSRAKRIRPSLVLECARMLGGSDEAALPFAVAVEMIHTYSLIHDDLPAMDNDDLRRGKPTCHKAYGEATALLAGDALLTRAFGVLAENTAVTPAAIRDAVAALSGAAGSFGMIGGQVIDLAGENARLPLPLLLKLHEKKTGALIAVSAELGCIAAGYSRDSAETRAAVTFARGIGLAFQIVDDILDATADAETLGKSVGSDAKSQKTTFLTHFDLDGARAFAARTTVEAKAALADLAGSEVLLALADYLQERSY